MVLSAYLTWALANTEFIWNLVRWFSAAAAISFTAFTACFASYGAIENSKLPPAPSASPANIGSMIERDLIVKIGRARTDEVTAS